jgi:hypothetical protein
MTASPGCWRLYGELMADAHVNPTVPALQALSVDCYAVQHPGGAADDRRQRHSVAVHLIALCLHVDAGRPPQHVAGLRGRISKSALPRLKLVDWPYLAPPTEHASVTVADVRRAADTDVYPDVLEAWTRAAWTAWAAHHDTVRVWAAATVGR